MKNSKDMKLIVFMLLLVIVTLLVLMSMPDDPGPLGAAMDSTQIYGQ